MTPPATVILILLACLFLLWRSNDATNNALGRAQTLEAAIPGLTAQRDSSRAATDSLAAVVARQAAVYSADSLRWAEERASSRALTARADATRRALTASLAEHMANDTTGLALLDSLTAQHSVVVTAMAGEILTLEEERSSLWGQRETLGQEIAALRATDARNRGIISQWEQVSAEQDTYISSQRRAKWFERAGAVAVVAVLLLR